MSAVLQELQSHIQSGDPVHIQVDGGQLVAPGGSDISDDGVIPGHNHWTTEPLCVVATDDHSGSISDGQGCDCLDCAASSDDVDSTPGADESLPGTGETHSINPPASPGILSEELSAAQQEPSDMATIYRCVEEQRDMDNALVSLGSVELKKLSSMTSLMRIREDQVLVTRLIVGHRSREVILCPMKMR